MTDEQGRTQTDQEDVQSWASQTKDLEKLEAEHSALKDEITAAANQLGHIERTVCDLVDNLHERRVFKTSFGLVLVERFRKKSKKYSAGSTPPPAEYGVRIDLLEVEE